MMEQTRLDSISRIWDVHSILYGSGTHAAFSISSAGTKSVSASNLYKST